jgi:hypothetical protein
MISWNHLLGKKVKKNFDYSVYSKFLQVFIKNLGKRINGNLLSVIK